MNVHRRKAHQPRGTGRPIGNEPGTGAVYGRRRWSSRAWRAPRQIAGLPLTINGTRKPEPEPPDEIEPEPE